MKNYYVLVFCVGFGLFSGCKSTQTGGASASYRHATDDSTLYGEQSPFLMPYNRILDPAGESVSFGDAEFENHSLDAVMMPDGKTLLVQDRFGLAFFDAKTRRLVHRWSYAKDSPHQRSMSAFSGIKAVVHHDSTFVFWGAGGRDKPNSYIMQAFWDGSRAKLVRVIPFEPIAPATIALPNEVAVREEAGELYVYTVLNGNNRLVKIRVANQQIVWTAATGVCPFGLTLVGNDAYVTNWAGPVPDAADGRETAGIPWGSAYVDPKTGAMSRGTVSVINTVTGKPETQINVGLHPNAIISSPDRQTVYVANGNSDYVSVIDTRTRQVTDSIFVGLFHKDGNGYTGSTPNALAVSAAGDRLYVANGLDNAVCVVDLDAKGGHTIKGYIPTEAYPSGIVLNGNEMYVTNLEATGARIKVKVTQSGGNKNGVEQKAYNSHKQLASVSFIPLPGDAQLKLFTEKVKRLNMQFRLALTERLPRKNAAPRPVPERIGEPSVFKYILYIIKENRTYDQVLGDMPEGDGMPALCIFGDSVTPNQHRLARDYMLMDNYHVSGKSSAEGHHWASAAMVTDYTEKSVRAWFRSYPHVLYDAMVYDKKGLIWNNALDHGKTVRIYGEACSCEFDKTQHNWSSLYRRREENSPAPFTFTNKTTISRIRPHLSAGFPGCDDETVSDQMRADAFISELNETAARPGAALPNLMVMSLPNDHTAGMNPLFPTPRAMVADNDLAVGRIVEAVMASRFADSTVIFISEDDSQAGWDHVSSYRTTGFVVSAYSRLQKTMHTNYNQTSMVRTMEQILGLPPMNVIDATALPMFDCFTDKPDFAFRYKAVPNRVALNEMNADPKKLTGAALGFANQSLEHGFYRIDQGHDDLLNRIIWFATKGNVPYPARLAGKDDDD